MTIGPEPITRMVSMSLLLGMLRRLRAPVLDRSPSQSRARGPHLRTPPGRVRSLTLAHRAVVVVCTSPGCLHEFDEIVEEVARVVRARSRFGVVLHRERLERVGAHALHF